MPIKPSISVVIDTYNHELFIEQAIISALEQDMPRSEIEILVVDDGSIDRTAEIARKFEPRIRFVCKQNGGQASAINFGTAHTTGHLVAFLDGDDVWMPNKLSRVAEEFENNPRLAMVYHRYCFWDSRDNSTWEPEYFGVVSGDIFDDHCKLLTYVAAPTSSLAFRRGILERIMPVPEQCSFMHDLYLVSCAPHLGPVKAIDECLTRNRVHGGNFWFVGKGQADPNVLGDRVRVRNATIFCMRQWFQTNTSRNVQAKARVLFARSRLIQDQDEFRLRAPHRFRFFWHCARYNLTYGSTMSRTHLAYRWSRAVVALLVGPGRASYIEGVRTRLKRAVDYFRRLAEGSGRPA